MKYFLAYLCVAIFVISPGLVHSDDDTDIAMIESIRFMGERGGGDVIHFNLNRNLDPNVLKLFGENPRMVFDFIETGYAAKEKKVIQAGGRFVKRIRVGVHQQPLAKTRVVIDLTSDKEFEFDKDYIVSEKVLEVRIFLKTAGVETKPTVAQQKSEKDKESQKQIAGEEPKKDVTSLADTVAANMAKQVKSQSVIKDERVGTTAAKKDTTDVHQTPETSGESVAKIPDADMAVESATAKEIPVLIDVSYENTTNKKEMVLFKLSGFHPPVVFAIEEDEPRIVCDFLDVQLGENTQQVLNSNGEYIRRVRVAKHSNPDKVRVVLDLAAYNDYDLKQVFFKEDNLFVVIISAL